MKIMKKSPLAAAIGTAVVSTLTAVTAHAEANPFAMAEMSEGYMQLAATDAAADKMGEKKCGATMKKEDGSCGEGKCGEGKCANSKAATDAAKDPAKEGKCGEGKCGEGKCGEKKAAAEAKAKEGKCGEGKCGGAMKNKASDAMGAVTDQAVDMMKNKAIDAIK